ncbi:MFS transporter [Microtetraspora sp. NBRC 13810]|uniref:CynX/NimT family MFS transporter n=1 Tax=Microtetraspora sp. NBRC 13810 TaxID=3030990 RepID=UPI0024A5CB9D|nr:MFS transporter [Microtetraspora sp. NBRC 13810]GLW05846.1 MFS transporter [Microtetraspora sp. NBRC 13810]
MTGPSQAPERVLPTPTRRRLARVLLVLGIVLIAANLRPAIAATATVLDSITGDLSLSGAAAGTLTTLPVLFFGLCGPAAPVLVRRLGIERTLALALAAIAAASALWLAGSTTVLFAGTVLVGAGAAVGNVLLPVLVRRDFPDRAGLVSGLYTTALASAAALAAAVTVPLGDAIGYGWPGALAVWGLLALAALVIWTPQLRRSARLPDDAPSGPGGVTRLLRDRLAWQVTGLMGLQALSYHTTLAWLPSVFTDAGLDRATAGVLLSVAGFVAIPVSLVLPTLAARRPDQRGWIVLLTAFTAAGLLGLLIAPTAAPYLWVILLGLGQGPIFPLTLTIIVLRSRTAEDTIALSTMAQSVGFVIAAAGPLTLGLLRTATGTWTAGVALLLALLAPQLLTGLASARDRHIASRPK